VPPLRWVRIPKVVACQTAEDGPRSSRRLVARELDATHVVVRVPFDARDELLHQHPDAFSVPTRFARHMMVVADLGAGDDGAVEDALEYAWRLQSQAAPDAGGEQGG
jgi:hypothetical protein